MWRCNAYNFIYDAILETTWIRSSDESKAFGGAKSEGTDSIDLLSCTQT